MQPLVTMAIAEADPHAAAAPLVGGVFRSTLWMTCADAQALSDWRRLKTPNSLIASRCAPSHNKAIRAAGQMSYVCGGYNRPPQHLEERCLLGCRHMG